MMMPSPVDTAAAGDGKGLEGLLRGFVQKYEQHMAASQLYTDAPEDLTCYRTYSGELIHYGVVL